MLQSPSEKRSEGVSREARYSAQDCELTRSTGCRLCQALPENRLLRFKDVVVARSVGLKLRLKTGINGDHRTLAVKERQDVLEGRARFTHEISSTERR